MKSTTQSNQHLHQYNYGFNLEKLTGYVSENSQAHHVFPKKIQSIFNTKGINIHDPQFGTWWDTSDHLKNAFRFNTMWEGYLKTNPSQSQIMDYGRELMKTYNIPVNF